MLDLLISGGTVVDGTGRARPSGRRRRRRGAGGGGGRDRRHGPHRHRRRRAPSGAGLRGPPHPLRRPADLGPVGQPVAVARRDHRDRWQLRLLPGAVGSGARRLPGPDDGAGRGDAAVLARAARLVVDVVRRLARSSRRAHRGERRLPRRALGRPPLGHGRGGGGLVGHREADGVHGGPAPPLLEEGALGFSTSQAHTHNDGDGSPVPSRSATRPEIEALCAAAGEHDGTTLEIIVPGCLNGFSDDEVDLMATLVAPGRPARQLERPRCVGHEPLRTGAPAGGVVHGGGAGGDGGGADAAPHHEDPALLRARGHHRRASRLARAVRRARPRAHQAAVGPGCPPPPRRGGEVQGGRHHRGPGQLADAPDRRDLRPRRTSPTRVGRWARWPPSGARSPSTRCSTSSSPTSCGRACARPSPSPRRTGS